MKKNLFIILALLILSACGENKSDQISNDSDNNSEKECLMGDLKCVDSKIYSCFAVDNTHAWQLYKDCTNLGGCTNGIFECNQIEDRDVITNDDDADQNPVLADNDKVEICHEGDVKCSNSKIYFCSPELKDWAVFKDCTNLGGCTDASYKCTESGDSDFIANDDDTNPEDECKDLSVLYSNESLDKVAENIKLEVYSEGWGNLLKTIQMAKEGEIKLEIEEENPYEGDTPQYFIYESASGFFTNIAYAKYGDTIAVDLDPVMSDFVNGEIFMVQHYFGPTLLSNENVTVKNLKGERVGCFNSGKFVIDIPAGNYVFSFNDMDGSYYDENVEIKGNYLELRVEAEAQAAKPNIYIYPEKKAELDVTLEFPLGGFVTTSIPDYGAGWHVTVEPDGTIDGKYGYLFYESQNPDKFQYAEGWTVAAGSLEGFFRENMSLYGFRGAEIEDFIDWWIPRLGSGVCYNIFPQTAQEIDPLIVLNISVTPDSIQRLFYAVRENKTCKPHLREPIIKNFERKGFSVLEWGVVLR